MGLFGLKENIISSESIIRSFFIRTMNIRKGVKLMIDSNNEDRYQMNIVAPEISDIIRQQMVLSEYLPDITEIFVENNLTKENEKENNQIRQYMIQCSLK